MHPKFPAIFMLFFPSLTLGGYGNPTNFFENIDFNISTSEKTTWPCLQPIPVNVPEFKTPKLEQTETLQPNLILPSYQSKENRIPDHDLNLPPHNIQPHRKPLVHSFSVSAQNSAIDGLLNQLPYASKKPSVVKKSPIKLPRNRAIQPQIKGYYMHWVLRQPKGKTTKKHKSKILDLVDVQIMK